MSSISRRPLFFWLFVAAVNTVGCTHNPLASNVATIVIDNATNHQIIEGFGATHNALVDGDDDHLTAELRLKAVNAVYGQVHLTTGNTDAGVLEAPFNSENPWQAQANDDDDPFHFNWNGFNFKTLDAARTKLIDLAKPLGFADFYLGLRMSVRFSNLWMKTLRTSNYNRYLDECGEQIAAGMIHWREAYGSVPRYVQLFNEPTSGNYELDPGSTQEVIDVIKRVGQRLRKEGFADVKFVVPNEETVDRSLTVARAILADPETREYVGAIGYHTYPYGSIYADVRRILATSGRAKPDSREIQIRGELRDLGRQYGIPVWMTEVSHGAVPALSFDGLIGRAIHIHDELVYTDASAYFGMENFVDTRPVHGRNVDPYDEEGSTAIVDLHKNQVFITAMGYAIGHYARWISRGSVRIDAISADPRIQVTAFRDPAKNRLIMVFINTSPITKRVDLRFNDFGNTTKFRFEAERSTQKVSWLRLTPWFADSASQTRIELVTRSVTTIAADL
jgi:O-glycosyl hydrolase